MQKAMLDLMRAFAAIVVSDEATAIELFDKAVAIEGQSPEAADVLRSVARQHRVKAIEMRAKGAALGERYDQLFRRKTDNT